MERTNLAPDGHEANLTPPPVTTRERGRGSRLGWVALTLATLWLIASVIVGVQVIQAKPAEVSALRVPTPSLSASSEHLFYGGDAYTGIQNAASDTEHAVVQGVNQLAAFQLALQRADSRRARTTHSETQKGLGFLIIGVGVLTFTVALTRTTEFH
jgi:hypothetical protein